MGARFVDQGDFRFAAAAKLVAEPGRKLESAGAPADDNNSMRAGCLVRSAGVAVSCSSSHRSLLSRCRAVAISKRRVGIAPGNAREAWAKSFTRDAHAKPIAQTILPTLPICTPIAISARDKATGLLPRQAQTRYDS